MTILSHRFLRNPTAAKQRFSELYARTATLYPISTRDVTKGIGQFQKGIVRRSCSEMGGVSSPAPARWRATPLAAKKKPNYFTMAGRFFRRIFGAE
jgi:hypothetical protein